jgi:hypothetical protein
MVIIFFSIAPQLLYSQETLVAIGFEAGYGGEEKNLASQF